MADGYVKSYLDSSVWIAAFTGEQKLGADGFRRCDIARHILEAAEKGQYPIFISALTFAEVHKVKGDGRPPLTAAEDEKILRYFENDFIRVVEVDRLIGEEANKFCRQYGLKPNDAIHLACALRARCEVLLFWDRPVTVRVNHPSIRVEEPRITGQLPLGVEVTPRERRDTPRQVEASHPEPPKTEAPALPATMAEPKATASRKRRRDVNQNAKRVLEDMIQRSEEPPNRGGLSLAPKNSEPTPEETTSEPAPSSPQEGGAPPANPKVSVSENSAATNKRNADAE